MKNDRAKFGRNLEAVRKKREVTQAALAHDLGITLAHYFYLKTGRRAPSFELITRARRILKCGYVDLFKGL